MGLSGLALVGFVAVHLLENLLILIDPSGLAYNTYVFDLHKLGSFLAIAELGLLALFLIHIFMAVKLTAEYKSARPIKYSKYQSKGAPSKSGIASRNMIITGFILFVFLILHILQFRFGADVAEGYIAVVEGVRTRDLFRLVHETFKNPLYVAIYCAVMIFLGFHLRHGFWSAFQSLGLNYPKISKPIYAFALILALVLAVGFFFIPLIIYFGGT